VFWVEKQVEIRFLDKKKKKTNTLDLSTTTMVELCEEIGDTLSTTASNTSPTFFFQKRFGACDSLSNPLKRKKTQLLRVGYMANTHELS